MIFGNNFSFENRMERRYCSSISSGGNGNGDGSGGGGGISYKVI